MKDLIQNWLKAKEAERQAINERRKIEDVLILKLNIDKDSEGTTNTEQEGYAIKVAGRIDRKVDGDKLQELAAEFGLESHLASLFRWKPELNLAVWKATDESITRPLADAITSKPGRPSFSISIKE